MASNGGEYEATQHSSFGKALADLLFACDVCDGCNSFCKMYVDSICFVVFKNLAFFSFFSVLICIS